MQVLLPHWRILVRASRYFSWASSSVRPTIGVRIANIFTDLESRPCLAASSRMALMRGSRMCGEGVETKIPSACFAPKAMPAGDVPV